MLERKLNRESEKDKMKSLAIQIVKAVPLRVLSIAGINVLLTVGNHTTIHHRFL